MISREIEIVIFYICLPILFIYGLKVLCDAQLAIYCKTDNTSFAAKIIFCIFLAVFLIFIWPTPYKYFETSMYHDPVLLKMNRFTGEAQYLWVGKWNIVKDATEELNPK